MTTGTVAQAGSEVLLRVQPGERVAQAGAELLLRVQPSHSVSQAGVEILYKAVPCVTQWCQIWSIERLDGTVHRFTSLDRDLVLYGLTYQACDSLTPTAAESANEVGSLANMELAGMISTDAIDEADLYAGRFDGARVEAWLVDWGGGGDSPKALLRGTFGKVDHGPAGFKVELIGDGARLQQAPLISTVQPGCRWTFGDSHCSVDLAPLTVTGTVTATNGRGFTDSTRAEAAGYFTRGMVTFVGGVNDGVAAEIKEHATGGVFTLWPRLPAAIQVGDAYSMTPGCTLNKAADGGTNGCTAWANVINFGGFEGVPGRDAISKTPTART